MELIKQTEGYKKQQAKHEEKLAELRKPIDPKKQKPWRVGQTLDGKDVYAPIVGPHAAKFEALMRKDIAVCTACRRTFRFKGAGLEKHSIVDFEGNPYHRSCYERLEEKGLERSSLMPDDRVYLVLWHTGAYSDRHTCFVCYFVKREYAESFVQRGQKLLDRITRLDPDMYDFACYSSTDLPTEREWADFERENGTEAASAVAELLEHDRSWAGSLDQIRELLEPRYKVEEVAKGEVRNFPFQPPLRVIGEEEERD